MEFDLNKITEQGIIIDSKISFGEEYLSISQIKELNDVLVKGKMYYAITGEVVFEGNVSGSMKLIDYNTNIPIDYPFEIELNEILTNEEEINKNLKKKTKNMLDLKEVLWENIVLEVPIRVSNSNDVETKSGEGWELRDENSKKDDPRLECFRALLDEGKE